MKNKKINLLKKRREYELSELSYNELLKNPIDQFNLWLEDAFKSNITDSNAMILSTYDQKIGVSSRVVLLKDIINKKFIFFTNYDSLKGKQINHNNDISLCFFWADLERQVRIKGYVKKISKKSSDLYFNIRPRMSKISAIVSKQSSYIDVSEKLENRILEFKKRLLKRPINWGGYEVNPYYIEFWQGRKNRLHDRFVYIKKGVNWNISRLSP
jgi:pyridoxamine 5'-phosphate oxidase